MPAESRAVRGSVIQRTLIPSGLSAVLNIATAPIAELRDGDPKKLDFTRLVADVLGVAEETILNDNPYAKLEPWLSDGRFWDEHRLDEHLDVPYGRMFRDRLRWLRKEAYAPLRDGPSALLASRALTLMIRPPTATPAIFLEPAVPLKAEGLSEEALESRPPLLPGESLAQRAGERVSIGYRRVRRAERTKSIHAVRQPPHAYRGEQESMPCAARRCRHGRHDAARGGGARHRVAHHGHRGRDDTHANRHCIRGRLSRALRASPPGQFQPPDSCPGPRRLARWRPQSEETEKAIQKAAPSSSHSGSVRRSSRGACDRSRSAAVCNVGSAARAGAALSGGLTAHVDARRPGMSTLKPGSAHTPDRVNRDRRRTAAPPPRSPSTK